MTSHGNMAVGSGNPAADIMWQGITKAGNNEHHGLGPYDPAGLLSTHAKNSKRYPYASAEHVDTFVSHAAQHGSLHGKKPLITGGLLGLPFKIKNWLVAQGRGLVNFVRRLLIGGGSEHGGHGSESTGGH